MKKLDEYLEYCLNRLAVEIGPRPAGSQANQTAAAFIGGEMKQAGYTVLEQKYPCPDWRLLSDELLVNGRKIRAVVNTHSPAVEIEAELVPVSTAEDIQKYDLTNRIAVLHGELTRTAFMPKNFDRNIYADEYKDRIIQLLEESKPGAVVLVSHEQNDMPLPLIEDSDLNLPSVTVHREEGPLLTENAGTTAKLKINTARKDSTGANIIGRWGNSKKKILLCAHYDTKHGTPGALDNASGVAALLCLAKHLKELEIKYALELVAFGGEDSWFPGDALYPGEYPPDNLVVAINLDGIGLKDVPTMMAVFGCSEKLVSRINKTAKQFGEYVQNQFYESNHGFFWPLGIPTLAFTSMESLESLGKVAHTKHDTPEVLDISLIEQTVKLAREIVWFWD